VNKLLEACYIELGKSQPDFTLSDTENDIYKKYASLYRKKYYILRHATPENFSDIKEYVEWLDNNLTLEENKTEVLKLKERLENE